MDWLKLCEELLGAKAPSYRTIEFSGTVGDSTRYMITSVAPNVKGVVLPLLPLSASRTGIGMGPSGPVSAATTVPNVGEEGLLSTGRYGRTSARYVLIVFEPWAEPEQPPVLQEVGALRLPSTVPLIG